MASLSMLASLLPPVVWLGRHRLPYTLQVADTFRSGFTHTSGGAPLPTVADTLQVAEHVSLWATLIPPVVHRSR